MYYGSNIIQQIARFYKLQVSETFIENKCNEFNELDKTIIDLLEQFEIYSELNTEYLIKFPFLAFDKKNNNPYLFIESKNGLFCYISFLDYGIISINKKDFKKIFTSTIISLQINYEFKNRDYENQSKIENIIKNKYKTSIKEIDKFIPIDTCDLLINESANFIKSWVGVASNKTNSKRRKSKTAILNNNAFIDFILSKIEYTIKIDKEKFQSPQIIKYSENDNFLPHFDSFNMSNISEEEKIKGQCISTFIIYLNDDFIGGETIFPNIDHKIVPKKQKALYYKNVQENNLIDYYSYHGGMPVLKGTKYIFVVWIREHNGN